MRHRTGGPGLDGVLLIDKPAGPTSHDVVARIRHTLHERRVGHTGTLDPRATGLLALVIGRATKLAAVLTAGHKTYEATIRLGVSTTTDDGEGTAVGDPRPVTASDDDIRATLDRFKGPIEQVPPSHSAKKVAGERAYMLARRAAAVDLKPVTVTIYALDWIGRTGDDVHVSVTASAGFYVRALARDTGAALGCGGHLAALRRTQSGSFSIAAAISLEEAERMGPDLAGRVIPPASALPHLPAVSVTEGGSRRVRHGNVIGPEHLSGQAVPVAEGAGLVKVLDPGGALIALARPSAGALHPVVVLG